MSFKVGDRVRVIKGDVIYLSRSAIGHEANIMEILQNNNFFEILIEDKLENGKTYNYTQSAHIGELELILDTPIKFKYGI